jgi:heme/copper-type cytochrome/quinol oxidase subunit 2
VNPAPKPRLLRLGVSIAGIYAVIIVSIYILIRIAAHNDGMQRVPLSMLALPWFRIAASLLMPALILNAAILFVLGILLYACWRAARSRKRTTTDPLPESSLLD